MKLLVRGTRGEVVLKGLSPDLIRRRLTPLFPGELIEDIVCRHDVVQRHRRTDATALVQVPTLGFAVGSESRTIAGFRRAYAVTTNRTLSRSSFCDRFTSALRQLLSDLLKSMPKEVAAPHILAPQLQQFRNTTIADATAFRLHRLLSESPATHPNQSGVKLHLIYSLTEQTVERFELADERSHEGSQFRMGSWLRGRLSLFSLGFYSYRRFTLTEENGGFFLSRLKANTSPRITKAHQKWRGRVVSLPDRRLQDVLDGLTREIIDVTTEVNFRRRPYSKKYPSATMELHVVGVRNEDTDDYHLYITGLPDEPTSEQVAALYDVRWEVEVLFRGLKPIHGLGKFQISSPTIVRLLVVAALLTFTASRASLGAFQRIRPGTMSPREH